MGSSVEPFRQHRVVDHRGDLTLPGHRLALALTPQGRM